MPAQPYEEIPASEQSETRLKRLPNILLIDDTVAILRSLNRLVKLKITKAISNQTNIIPSEIISETNPLKGRDLILSQDKPMVIVSDLQMPEMTGIELARQTREHRQKHNMPLIVNTGTCDPNHLESLDQLISDGVVHSRYSKPSEQLCDDIKDLVLKIINITA